MSISPKYFDYLHHFGKTICLRDVDRRLDNFISLRHDVDYCIDTALEMSFWEKENGIKSTYFMLHTAEYFKDPDFFYKCLQIQDFGHEVGIHTNLITQWFNDSTPVENNLVNILEQFRSYNVDIVGTSAHGDRSCYANNFINYWLFNELMPLNPIERESVLNAEGIFEGNIDHRIIYPADDKLINNFGKTLPLWNISMKDNGLKYEASHLPFDNYFSDSGGYWKRTDDPITKDLSKGRSQVLMHPLHWKGPKKIFFFLSTSRSGSKWFSNALNKASSCESRHEYTLNNYNEDNSQMTNHNLHELLNSEKKINEGLLFTRKYVDDLDCDYAEFNVYLPLVLDNLIEEFPDAQLVHLTRSPRDIVRSIFNRGWYDNPFDTAHPIVTSISDWELLKPFEKCCKYVESVSLALLELNLPRVKLENVSRSMVEMEKFLKELDIAFYPLLARLTYKERVNVNKVIDLPVYSKWPVDKKLEYSSICSDLDNKLAYFDKKYGYHNLSNYFFIYLNSLKIYQKIISKLKLNKARNVDKIRNVEKIVSLNTNSLKNNGFCVNVNIEKDGKKLIIREKDKNKHASFLLGGSAWDELELGKGWSIKRDYYYTIIMNFNISENIKSTIFCLMYDNERKLIYKRVLGNLKEDMTSLEYGFAAMGKSAFFNIAIYLPVQSEYRGISLEEVSIYKYSNKIQKQ